MAPLTAIQFSSQISPDSVGLAIRVAFFDHRQDDGDEQAWVTNGIDQTKETGAKSSFSLTVCHCVPPLLSRAFHAARRHRDRLRIHRNTLPSPCGIWGGGSNCVFEQVIAVVGITMPNDYSHTVTRNQQRY